MVSSESSKGMAKPDRRQPNVVLIVLDCARAKNFHGGGGTPTALTPFIDSLASRGTTFSRAVAPSNWTLPSHASIFTGTYPVDHGIRTYRRVVDPLTTTAGFLKAAGYRTGMFTENLQIVGPYGLETGFDVVRSNTREKAISNIFGVQRGRSSFAYSPWFVNLLARVPPMIAPLSWTTRMQENAFKRDVCTPAILNEFEQWVKSEATDSPFYGFVNILDTHEPYSLVTDSEPLGLLDRTYLYSPRSHLLLVPGLQERVKWDPMIRGYVESISAADRKVGRVIAILRERGVLDNTMIIVTSDHGQAFGEMGNVFHGVGATDSVTRVPLVVAPPSGISVPLRVDRWVSLCEIDAWIRSIASGAEPYNSDGRSTYPLLREDPASNVVYSEGPPVSDVNRSMRGMGTDKFWSHRLLAAYRENEKFILDTQTGEVLHWDMSQDPDLNSPTHLSVEDAGRVRDEVFGAYEAKEAKRSRADKGGSSSLDIEIDERLRSWGYV
jgi:arylsulfatase A-like enzyme